MKLLLVDDEQYMLDDLMTSIDWTALGFQYIFTALNARQALEILDTEEISLILCDIEMPQINGVDFLRHMKEMGMGIETIFLTCHAEFSYAKEALHLGAAEYLLKPVDCQELTAAVAKASERIQARQVEKNNSLIVQHAKKNQGLITERFWSDILTREIVGSYEIASAAAARNIALTPDERICPLLVKFHSFPEHISTSELRAVKNDIREKAAACFSFTPAGICSVFMAENILMVLCLNADSLPVDEPESSAIRFIKECRLQYPLHLSCYIGNRTRLEELAREYDTLRAQDHANVAYTDHVFSTQLPQTVSTQANEKWILKLSALINQNDEQEITRLARDYLDNLMHTTGLNSSTLYWFQQDFTQMIYEKASQNGLLPHHLLDDPETIELSRQAPSSVEATLAWISHISHKIISQTQNILQSQSVVHTLTVYIKQHLTEDINREEVSAQVFMNPDYLDRLFKKELGLSVSKYITQEKVNLAKHILSTTDASIADTAAQLGFSNLSNFATMFKRQTGFTPNEYRRRFNAASASAR